MITSNNISTNTDTSIADPSIGIDIEKQPFLHKKVALAREQLSKVGNLDVVITEIKRTKKL